jgi:hypothetical protein
MKTFFLRFYGVSAERIEDCLKEMRDAGHVFTKGMTRPITTSVNVAIPQNSTEVELVFETIEARSLFVKDEETKLVYRRYATTGVEAEVVLRSPGMTGFKV